MWHVFKIKYNVHVQGNMIEQILHDLHPEASSLKKKKKLRRRQYCWHIDGERHYSFLLFNI